MNLRAITLLSAVLLLAGCGGGTSPRTVEDFNFGWKFSLGDNPDWSGAAYDDASWRELHLPHDWSVEGEFSKFLYCLDCFREDIACC